MTDFLDIEAGYRESVNDHRFCRSPTVVGTKATRGDPNDIHQPKGSCLSPNMPSERAASEGLS